MSKQTRAQREGRAPKQRKPSIHTAQDLLLEQRRKYMALDNAAAQLEQMVLAQNKLIDELSSVACAWAFDLGLRMSDAQFDSLRLPLKMIELTPNQIRAALEENP